MPRSTAKLAAAASGLLAAPLFVTPAKQTAAPATRVSAGAQASGLSAQATGAGQSQLPALALGLVGSAAVVAASTRGRGKVQRAAFDPTAELGVQAPVRFWDPLGFCDDGDEAAFKRRRAVEIKHGRIAMLATIGYIVPEYYRFPGYLSPSEDIKFTDVPNGFAAFSKVPMLGWAQIVIFAGLMEGRLVSQETAPGDYGLGKYGALGLFGRVEDPEERKTKLNAEIANGRLAMFAIIGLFFQNGVTGSTSDVMYGLGDQSGAVLLRVFVPVLAIFGLFGETFRQGPDENFKKFYTRTDYYGKDRI